MNSNPLPGRGVDEPLEMLCRYCRECGYQGWDDLDGLSSQLRGVKAKRKRVGIALLHEASLV